METLLNHRDGSGGLFIGTSIVLLALMNSAPAELLHLLVHAALQPSLAVYLQRTAQTAKKNAGNYSPALEYCFRNAKPFFEEKDTLPDGIKPDTAKKLEWFGRLLFINLVKAPL